MENFTDLIALIVIIALLMAFVIIMVSRLNAITVALEKQPEKPSEQDTQLRRLEELADSNARATLLLEQLQAELKTLNQESAGVKARDLQAQQSLSGLQEALTVLRNQLAATSAQSKQGMELSQQTLETIRGNIRDINEVMVNKKARGNWGEYQLSLLLDNYAGESDKIYETQRTLSNGRIADAALHLPGTEKMLCIDSKFPLEAYQALMAAQGDVDATERAARMLRTNVKKHIDDVSGKYILPETVDLAVIFIPSEAVYLEICATLPEMIDYAVEKHVLLTSPTTLIGVVFTLVASTRDFERSRNIDEIVRRITLLSADVERLSERLDRAQDMLRKTEKSFEDVGTSGKKIAAHIEKLAAGTVD